MPRKYRIEITKITTPEPQRRIQKNKKWDDIFFETPYYQIMIILYSLTVAFVFYKSITFINWIFS